MENGYEWLLALESWMEGAALMLRGMALLES